jgi:hypothetical protein
MRLIESFPEMRGGGIKENDGYQLINYIWSIYNWYITIYQLWYIVRTFVGVTMYHKYKNNMGIKSIKKWLLKEYVIYVWE